jgi:hypothetical protein
MKGYHRMPWRVSQPKRTKATFVHSPLWSTAHDAFCPSQVVRDARAAPSRVQEGAPHALGLSEGRPMITVALIVQITAGSSRRRPGWCKGRTARSEYRRSVAYRSWLRRAHKKACAAGSQKSAHKREIYTNGDSNPALDHGKVRC